MDMRRARRFLCGELQRLGWKYFPSEANFVLVQFGEGAKRIRRLLEGDDILVRDRSYEIAGCVRITVGTMSQTRTLVRA